MPSFVTKNSPYETWCRCEESRGGRKRRGVHISPRGAGVRRAVRGGTDGKNAGEEQMGRREGRNNWEDWI